MIKIAKNYWFAKINAIDGLRYDGGFPSDEPIFAQFTEVDKSRLSYGATFYVKLETITADAIKVKRKEVLQRFSK